MSIDDGAMYAATYGVVAGSSADQTTALQSAMDAAYAAGLANNALQQLVLPTGATIRCRNLVPKPYVHLNLNGAMLKCIDDTTQADFRCVLYADGGSGSWIHPATSDQNNGMTHFRLSNGTIDGNAGYATPWSWVVKRIRVTDRGKGYSAVASVVVTEPARTGTTTKPAATGAAASAYMGVDPAPTTAHTLNSGGSNYAAGDEIILTSGGGTVYNATYTCIRVLTVDGSGAVLTYTISECGAYSALPSGPLLHASVRNYATRLPIVGRTPSGFSLSPNASGYYVSYAVMTAQGLNHFFEDFPEQGGDYALTVSGSATTSATLAIMGEGTYFKISSDHNGADTEHCMGLYLRMPPGGTNYLFKVDLENVRFQNITGDSVYHGGSINLTARNCSSHNCYRGGVPTHVSFGYTDIIGWRATGWGLGFDCEISGGYSRNDTSKARATTVTIVNGGTGYKIGDLVWSTAGVYNKPAVYRVAKVDAASTGVITLLNGVDQGSYLSFPVGSGLATDTSGTGTGATLTLVSGDDYGRFRFTNVHTDTTRGSNFLFFFGEWMFNNCSFRGDTNYLLGTNGDQIVAFNNCIFEARVGPAANITTVPPHDLTFTDCTFSWASQDSGAVTTPSNVQSDRSTCILIGNDSAGTVMADARIRFTRPIIKCGKANRNMVVSGLRCYKSYFYGSGINTNIRVEDFRLVGDMDYGLYTAGGFFTVAGGDPGPRCGTVLAFSSDATAIGAIKPYQAGIKVERWPLLSGAGRMMEIAAGAGTQDADTRYGIYLEGNLPYENAVFGGAGAVNGPSYSCDATGMTLSASDTPAALPNKFGFKGLTWKLRSPVVGMPFSYLCTTASLSAPVYAALDGSDELSGTATIDIASIAASGISAEQSITVTGAHVGDVVRVTPATDLGSNCEIIQERVSATNIVKFRARNLDTVNPLDPPSTVFHAYVSRMS